jgi:hypothetical protein
MRGQPLSDSEIDYRMALRSAARNYQRSLLITAGIAAVGLAVLWATVSLQAGVLFCAGLGLGVLNSQMVQRSLVRAVTEGTADRKAITLGVLRRLALITALAAGLAYFYRPDGWLVFVGLMIFQMLTIATVLGGLARQVKRS